MTEQGGWAPDPGHQPQQPGQAPQWQPGYPAYQGYPGGWPHSPQPAQTGPPTRPDSITRAIRVMWAAAALSVVGGVIGALVSINGDTSTGPFSQSNDLSQSDRDLIHTAGVIGGIIGVLIVVALWLWMAWANGKGKLWARTTATVFAVISAVFWLFSLLGLVVLDLDTDSTARVAAFGLNTVGQALNAWIMYLLYRPESTAYYEAVSHPTPTYPYAYAYGYGHPYAYGGSQPYAYGSGQPYPQGQSGGYPYPYPYPYVGQPPQTPPDEQAPPPSGPPQPPTAN